jgi:hypothetical protein
MTAPAIGWWLRPASSFEFLQQHYPGPIRLIPDEPARQLDVRLWDRFFDLYVSVPMQKVVTDRIRPPGSNDPHGVAADGDIREQGTGTGFDRLYQAMLEDPEAATI